MGLVLGLVFAVVVGTAHYTGHLLGGDRDSFDDAGVSEAGLAVTAVAFLLGLFIGP